MPQGPLISEEQKKQLTEKAAFITVNSLKGLASLTNNSDDQFFLKCILARDAISARFGQNTTDSVYEGALLANWVKVNNFGAWSPSDIAQEMSSENPLGVMIQNFLEETSQNNAKPELIVTTPA